MQGRITTAAGEPAAGVSVGVQGTALGSNTDSNGDFIFTLEDGRPVAPVTFHKLWQRLQKDAGVPVMRLHDLRHLHVSLLVSRGFDPRAIADRVGHTDPAFTMRRYAHMFEEQRQAAAVNLTDLLAPKQVSNSVN